MGNSILPFQRVYEIETDRPAVIQREDGKKDWLLKKLTPKHKTILSLKAQGEPLEQIARLCKCTPQYVTLLARQPLAKKFISEIEEFLDEQMASLYHKSINAISEGLDRSQPMKERLQAARLQMEASGRLGGANGKGKEQESAEDVIQKIFQIHAQNVQINNISDGKEK